MTLTQPRRAVPTALAAAGLMAAALVATGLAASLAGARAQSLPPAGTITGEVRRDAGGKIVVAPPAAAPAAPMASPAPAPAKPPPSRPKAAAAPPATVPAVNAPPSAPVRRPPQCPAGAVTCVEAIQTSRETASLPITFGQPFARGDVPRTESLIARDDKGSDLPLQIDAGSAHPDGSLRFAVLSTEISQMATGERRIVSLFRGKPAERAAPAPASPTLHELRVELNVRAPQITAVTLGNRTGHDPGIPFQAGEKVTIRLGDDPVESFSVTVAGDLAGGYFNNYAKLAEALVAQINSTSRAYRAFKGAESYEKFWISTTEGHDRPFAVRFDYAGQARIATAQQEPFHPAQRFTAVKRPDDGLAPARTWLDGAVAVERDYLVPLKAPDGTVHPHLAARIHWRNYLRSGAVRADVIVENDWAYAPGPQNWVYSAAIFRDGAEIYRQPSFVHYHHARWHHLVWSAGRSEPDVRHDVPYFLRSGIVPHYDETLRIPETVLADESNALAKADTGPMGPALVTVFMPMTGGRADIGPLPRWVVLYLLTMDPGQRRVLLANADAGATIPMHYRDKPTDRPATLDDHPGMATQFGKPFPRDAFPAVASSETPWAPEVAHHPSLFYVPYLVTGDLFYLEEQQFWTCWVLASVDPAYRRGGEALVSFNQLRGQAWSLRTLGEAAVATPDADPLKGFFVSRLANNLDWYLDRYPRNRNADQASKIGVIDIGGQPGHPGQGSPWQQDFMFLAVGHLAEMGIPKADEFAGWLARFTVGRWTSDAAGFCHRMAPAYYIDVRRKTDGTLIGDWATLFRENRDSWNPDAGCPDAFPFGNPDSPSDYIANSYGMLGMAAGLDLPGAREAFARLAHEAPGMLARFSQNPTFDIVPYK